MLAHEPRWSDLVRLQAEAVRSVHEQVFNHRAYTGRSGSMFGYEGLGSIYWHMVAKLLLAVQENLNASGVKNSKHAAALTAAYYDVRAGLGFNKSPADYGAFPTDPYSHTPGHSGAQQPGMTGQVKEEVLTRMGELGVAVADGMVSFAPSFLREAEFLKTPATFRHVAAGNEERELQLSKGELAFTFCGVPVVYHRTEGAAALRLDMDGEGQRVVLGQRLDASTSALLFRRSGVVKRIDVDLGSGFLPIP
jgi:hypothetical protein